MFTVSISLYALVFESTPFSKFQNVLLCSFNLLDDIACYTIIAGIKACIEAGEMVDEEQFEISVDIHGIRDGPQLGRFRLLYKVNPLPAKLPSFGLSKSFT